MSTPDEQALGMIHHILPQLPPPMQRSVQDALARNTPPAQIIQWIRSQKEMVERQRMQQQQLAQQQHGNTQVSPMPNSMVGGGPMGGGFHPENQQAHLGGRLGQPAPGSSQHQPGGMPPPPGPGMPAASPQAPMGPGAPGPGMMRHSQRQGFFKMLNDLMVQHNNPLPPVLTGVPNPNFDPSKSRFNVLDIPGEGCFRFAGKAIDVYDLFTLVMQTFGGSTKLNQTNGWPQVVGRLGLTETAPTPNGMQVATAAMLPQYFRVILGPLEEMYFRQQQARTSPSRPNQPGPNEQGMGMAAAAGSLIGQKRKAEDDMRLPARPSTPPVMQTEARKHILPDEPIKPGDERRYKIEYVPIARTLDTYGGRKLEDIERQLVDIQARRQLRPHDELGTVDIEGLTLSLGSGLGLEMSYALTTLTMLSTLAGGTNAQGGMNTGYPLHRCEDLLDVIVDVLEDVAFGCEEEDEPNEEPPVEREQIWTRAGLIRQVDESSTLPTKRPQSSFVRNGPHQPASAVILTILNLLRNLTGHEQNPPFMASNPRLLDTLARISDVVQDEHGRWRPLSDEIELHELLKIHTDTTSLIGMLDMQRMKLSNHQRRTARRLYSMLIAPLVDPEEKLAPRHIISPLHGIINAHVDSALDAFAKLSVRDSNRIACAKIIPPSELIAHFNALFHMLPLTDEDFDVTTTAPNNPAMAEPLIGYIERVMQCLHSLAFLAPAPVKKKLRKTPGLVSVFVHMAQYYIGGVRRSDGVVFGEHGGRNGWMVVVRRAYETLSLLDLCRDAFDPVPATPIAFAPPGRDATALQGSSKDGSSSAATGEDSNGLLSSRFSEVLVTLLLRETNDDVAFRELESLLRLPTTAVH